MNMKFSDRMGITKPRDAIQIESMDEALINGLWNMLHKYYWNDFEYVSGSFINLNDDRNARLRRLTETIIEQYFNGRLDEIHVNFYEVKKGFEHWFFNSEWYEVYNFIEFVGNNGWPDDKNRNFQKACNEVMEKEMSGHRFVGGVITPISNTQELESIEEALGSSSDPVKEHLTTALTLLSDRQDPDFRSSIHESISAVEGFSAEKVGEKPELCKLLKKLDKIVPLHPALKKAFESLYGYTSDNGIRHAKTKDSLHVDFHDAKFMLVACTTFINYVNGKLEE